MGVVPEDRIAQTLRVGMVGDVKHNFSLFVYPAVKFIQDRFCGKKAAAASVGIIIPVVVQTDVDFGLFTHAFYGIVADAECPGVIVHIGI